MIDNYNTESGALRLAGGVNVQSGRIELFHNGTWGTVCDDSFAIPAADVACRQLGYPRSVSIATSGPGSGPIWLDNVGCQGNEQFLVNCTHNGLGVNDCDHTEDVGVICANGTLIFSLYHVK